MESEEPRCDSIPIALVDWDNTGEGLEAQAILRAVNIHVESFGVSRYVNFGRVNPPIETPRYRIPVAYVEMSYHLKKAHPDFFKTVERTLRMACAVKIGPDMLQYNYFEFRFMISIGIRTQRVVRDYFRFTPKQHPPKKVTVFNVKKRDRFTAKIVCAIVFMIYELDARAIVEHLNQLRPRWIQNIEIYNYTF